VPLLRLANGKAVSHGSLRPQCSICIPFTDWPVFETILVGDEAYQCPSLILYDLPGERSPSIIEALTLIHGDLRVVDIDALEVH